jgi:hypothetical protein
LNGNLSNLGFIHTFAVAQAPPTVAKSFRSFKSVDQIKTLELRILGFGIEAGTRLSGAREVTMAEDVGVGIVCPQTAQQGMKGGFLFTGPGVSGKTLGCQAALVADADAVLVVMAGMGTGEVLVTGVIDMAVLGDVIVVAGETETGIVAGDEVLNGEPTVAARGAAVNDDQINSPHSSSLLVFLEESHAAALHADGAGNGGEDGGYDSQNLFPCR